MEVLLALLVAAMLVVGGIFTFLAAVHGYAENSLSQE